ncbi:hypothetical protein [Antrihabitans spumae]|uniref:Uncharacterized protein n=1 Tax=Antrihabitans spumae TaxID=3373370 RepID=A0ABW7KBI8_9NOCA
MPTADMPRLHYPKSTTLDGSHRSSTLRSREPTFVSDGVHVGRERFKRVRSSSAAQGRHCQSEFYGTTDDLRDALLVMDDAQEKHVLHDTSMLQFDLLRYVVLVVAQHISGLLQIDAVREGSHKVG